jgi:hypothetical protein
MTNFQGPFYVSIMWQRAAFFTAILQVRVRLECYNP